MPLPPCIPDKLAATKKGKKKKKKHFISTISKPFECLQINAPCRRGGDQAVKGYKGVSSTAAAGLRPVNSDLWRTAEREVSFPKCH